VLYLVLARARCINRRCFVLPIGRTRERHYCCSSGVIDWPRLRSASIVVTPHPPSTTSPNNLMMVVVGSALLPSVGSLLLVVVGRWWMRSNDHHHHLPTTTNPIYKPANHYLTKVVVGWSICFCCWLVDCCVLCQPIMLHCSLLSVFSAAFLVGVDDDVPTYHRSHPIVVKCIVGSSGSQPIMDDTSLKEVCFASPLGEQCFY